MTNRSIKAIMKLTINGELESVKPLTVAIEDWGDGKIRITPENEETVQNLKSILEYFSTYDLTNKYGPNYAHLYKDWL